MASDCKPPRVTVIVPNYNHDRFLGDRLRSVFAQSFQDFELIYIDDGSTDGSNKVAQDFATDKRMILEFGEENSGNPFVQCNKGLPLFSSPNSRIICLDRATTMPALSTS